MYCVCSATTLASLSADLEICKQMFSYGAIKPLLNVSDGTKTNEACMLAGMGCVIQLCRYEYCTVFILFFTLLTALYCSCRIPEIGIRMVGQGAIPLVEKAIMMKSGHGNQAIREKALYVLGYLSKIEAVRGKLCTPVTLEGVHHEFTTGTMASKCTIMQLLMNVHSCYEGEGAFVLRLRDPVLDLLKTGPWNAKNLAIKLITVVYRTDEDRWDMVDKGMVEAIFDVIQSKGNDLQEAPMVCLLHLCTHADIPPLMLNKGAAKVAASLLKAEDPIIRELAVILLKALLLYNSFEVERVTPADQSYLLKRDIYNPQLFGAEYGGLIQEFLQTIVENRRDQDYLINMFSEEEVDELKLTKAELEKFQLTFMELDAECRGALEADELKLLMVLMGERMDKEEIRELLEEYDTDHSGGLDFKEFVVMMKGWNTRFGKGVTRLYNQSTKRGAIGKSRRAWRNWWSKDLLEEAQVQAAKERNMNKKEETKELELMHLGHEQMRLRRENEMRLRAQGYSVSPNYADAPNQASQGALLPYAYNYGNKQPAQPQRGSVVSRQTQQQSQYGGRLPPIEQQGRMSVMSDLSFK